MKMAKPLKSLAPKCHVRSISLPSRLLPNSIKFEFELNKMKTSVLAASPLSADNIQNGLVGLAELYNSLEELIHSPRGQQALRQDQTGVLVEEVLEGWSIGLLDTCGTLKDLLSQMKENVQDLQSALRRKGGDMSTESCIMAYISSRKIAKKTMARSLRVLKQMEDKSRSSLPSNVDQDQHLLTVISYLREVSAITIVVFRSLLAFLSCTNTKPSTGWSLISNLMMKNKEVSEKDQGFVNEVECVDLALYSLQTKVDVQTALRRLQKLDACVENLEGGVDCLFRRLIQSRASLLFLMS